MTAEQIIYPRVSYLDAINQAKGNTLSDSVVDAILEDSRPLTMQGEVKSGVKLWALNTKLR
jgi:hypothetical protein